MSKYLKKQDKKSFRFSLRPLCTFAVWLILFSLMSTGVTYGKYHSSATASDTATVAKFGMSVSASEIADTTLSIGGEDLAQICTITFADTGTEVPVNHVIKFSGVPSGVSVSINDTALTGDTFTKSIAASENKTGTYTVKFAIADEDVEQKDYSVTISAYAEQAS